MSEKLYELFHIEIYISYDNQKGMLLYLKYCKNDKYFITELSMKVGTSIKLYCHSYYRSCRIYLYVIDARVFSLCRIGITYLLTSVYVTPSVPTMQRDSCTLPPQLRARLFTVVATGVT